MGEALHGSDSVKDFAAELKEAQLYPVDVSSQSWLEGSSVVAVLGQRSKEI